MHNDGLRPYFRFRECGFESLYAIGIDVGFVAVEFWYDSEELHRRHVGVGCALDGHVNAAVVDRVRTEELGHIKTRIERMIRPIRFLCYRK